MVGRYPTGMPETIERKELEDLQQDLQDVQERLRRHRIVESLVERQQMPKHELVESLVHKQHLTELRTKLDQMHAADIAYILEALPINERLVLWDLVKAERDGEILLELSEPVRESVIRTMDSDELVAAVETLDTDEIAELAPDLPDEVIQDVFQSLPVAEREQLRAAMSYPEDAVGALMDFDVVSIRDDVTLETVTRYLRRFEELPDHTDQLFVVDREQRLKGVLPIAKLVVTDLERPVAEVMLQDFVTLYPDDKAQDAAQAFERYDLVSAAVIDQAGKLVGRVTVDAVVDFIRERSESEALAQGRLTRDRGRVRAGVGVDQEPLGVARDQPRDRVHRLAGHRRLRGLDREAGRARRADADRRRHRRQLGQPDDHDDRARARARPDPDRAGAEALREGDRRRARERRGLGRDPGRDRLGALRQLRSSAW